MANDVAGRARPGVGGARCLPLRKGLVMAESACEIERAVISEAQDLVQEDAAAWERRIGRGWHEVVLLAYVRCPPLLIESETG